MLLRLRLSFRVVWLASLYHRSNRVNKSRGENHNSGLKTDLDWSQVLAVVVRRGVGVGGPRGPDAMGIICAWHVRLLSRRPRERDGGRADRAVPGDSSGAGCWGPGVGAARPAPVRPARVTPKTPPRNKEDQRRIRVVGKPSIGRVPNPPRRYKLVAGRG